ncbi:MAG TPA: hypothetical protein VFS82_08630 [Lysobacter sp.]|nr:hypothetical protein [Lysobacter sp.]
MKLSLLAALVSLSLIGLAACASMDRQSDTAAMQPGVSGSSVTGQSDISQPDIRQLYIAKVERIARRRGIDVVWVNLPVFPEKQPMEKQARE